jgi:glutathione S-transferase
MGLASSASKLWTPDVKLTFSAASPYARKVRISAIELGLIDKIELVPTTVSPTTMNEDYSSHINPLRKLPALILDNGDTVVDSYVIVEYLDDLAGGGKLIPASGPKRWQVKTEHAILQGMLEAMLLCRYEKLLRPEALRWPKWVDDQWDRAWHGLKWFEERPDTFSRPLDIVQIGLVCVLGYADFRFPDSGWRDAFPNIVAFNDRMMQRDSVKMTLPPSA